MTFAHGIYAQFFKNLLILDPKISVVYVKQFLFHLKLRKNGLMLGEFKCNQHVFVHLFSKSLFFNINCSTEFLSTQMHTFLANLSQNILWKSHARR